MENSLIPQGIEIVQKAIAADDERDFEKALALYRDALARFTMGLKYEKNEARKKLVIERVEGYMNRAEELSDYLKKQAELDKNGGGGGVAAAKKGEGGDDDKDAETKKLRGALSAAIVSEKPNISWDDVAGLDNAKESLKEVSKKRENGPKSPWDFRVICWHVFFQLRFVTANETRHAHIRSFPFYAIYRRSFCRPNSLSSLPASANPSRVSCSMVPPERVNRIWPKRWQPKPIRPSLVSAVPISFPSGRVNPNVWCDSSLKWPGNRRAIGPLSLSTKSILFVGVVPKENPTRFVVSRQSS